MTGPPAPTTSAIREINARHGMRWKLERRLPGGYSDSGALLVRDGPERAVLKVHRPGRTVARIAATAAMIDAAIAAGWPTPPWLASGVLAGGEAYVLREYVDGTQPTSLGEHELEMLLETNRLQADLRPSIDADWSGYTREMFPDVDTVRRRLGDGADVRALADRLRSLTDGARDVALPTTDLVHGDVTLLNTIIHDGRAFLIDAEYAGKGTRSYDLATLLVHAGTGGMGASPETIQRLRDACIAIAGQDAARLGVAVRIVGLVEFGRTHWPEDVGAFAARAAAFLDRDLAG